MEEPPSHLNRSRDVSDCNERLSFKDDIVPHRRLLGEDTSTWSFLRTLFNFYPVIIVLDGL